MEMFIDASDLVPAIRKYIDFMDTIRDQKQSNSTINVMVRYVARDDLLLSPMQGRDTAVISVIVLGDAVKSGDQRDFELYASGLQNICQTHYSGRPHWGKVNFVDEYTPKYLSSIAYPKTMSIFKEIAQRLDPAGVLVNEYLKERLGDEQGEGMHAKGVM